MNEIEMKKLCVNEGIELKEFEEQKFIIDLEHVIEETSN